MTRELVLGHSNITSAGWIVLSLRLAAMAILLVICTPLHFLWKLVGAGRWWPRVFLAGVGAIAGVRIRREGKPVRGALLLANHVSWLDIPVLSRASGTAFVAHDGLAAFPFLKWLCEMNDTVFIARHERGTLAQQVEQVRVAMSATGCLTLFPEGTTSDGTGVRPFKSSLLSALELLPAGVVVQPVALIYDDVPEIAWVGDEPGLDNFKRILARAKPIGVTLCFLPPLDAAIIANRKTAAAAAQSAVAGALPLPRQLP